MSPNFWSHNYYINNFVQKILVYNFHEFNRFSDQSQKNKSLDFSTKIFLISHLIFLNVYPS